MTDEPHALLCRLGSEAGHGVVRLETTLAAPVDDVWSAWTDPDRLDSWLGRFDGDLRAGGTYRAHVHASGAEHDGRIERCDPARGFTVRTGDDDAQRIVVEVSADADRTRLTIEQRGLPLEWVAAFGAGLQVHVEDLAAHLRGDPRWDSDARMGELHPIYQQAPVSAG